MCSLLSVAARRVRNLNRADTFVAPLCFFPFFPMCFPSHLSDRRLRNLAQSVWPFPPSMGGPPLPRSPLVFVFRFFCAACRRSCFFFVPRLVCLRDFASLPTISLCYLEWVHTMYYHVDIIMSISGGVLWCRLFYHLVPLVSISGGVRVIVRVRTLFYLKADGSCMHVYLLVCHGYCHTVLVLFCAIISNTVTHVDVFRPGLDGIWLCRRR